MKLYPTKQALYNAIAFDDEGDYIATPVYSEDTGELLGYKVEYV